MFLKNKDGILGSLLLVAVAANVSTTYADSDEKYCGLLHDDSDEFAACWYVGGAIGLTHVDPEGEVNGWSTSDDSSYGWKIFIGRHFTPHWFAEFSYMDAGEAGLENRNPALTALIPDAAITYKIPSLMAGYYLWEKKEGFNLYAKAGVASIRTQANDSRIGEQKQTATQLVWGLGADYRFDDSPWKLALEFDSYDQDAAALFLRVSRYIGGERKKSKPVAAQPEPIQEPVPVVVKVEPKDSDNDGVMDEQDACPQTESGQPVDETGCALFDGVMAGVTFESNKAVLTPQATEILDEAAQTLNRFSLVHVEIQAHTDSVGSEKYNQQLSQQRAASVREYLISKGIAAERMVAKGYGESVPMASNDSAEGRQQNRRVEFKVIDTDQ